MPTKLSELFSTLAQSGSSGPKPLFPESAIPAKTLFPDSAQPAKATVVTNTPKPLFQDSAQAAKPGASPKPLFETSAQPAKPVEPERATRPLFHAPYIPLTPIPHDEAKAAEEREKRAMQDAYTAKLTDDQKKSVASIAALGNTLNTDHLGAFNRKVTAPATSLFADAATSNHSRARELLLPNLQTRSFPPDLLSYMETLATETLARGARRLDEAVEVLGRENMALHNRISDYNVDYDRLEVGESIKKAHQLVTGKKALFERRLTIDDVVPHLEVISAKAGVFKDRLLLFMDAAHALVLKVEATELVYQSLYAELPTSEAGRTGSTLGAVKTSSSLLLPQVQMLQQEADVQLEDVNRMLMVAIPTWKSAMKK
jgi:hypothetical protein